MNDHYQTEIGNEGCGNDDIKIRNQEFHQESIAVEYEDELQEARKLSELGKMLGFSSSNEIDVIWAVAKNQKD